MCQGGACRYQDLQACTIPYPSVSACLRSSANPPSSSSEPGVHITQAAPSLPLPEADTACMRLTTVEHHYPGQFDGEAQSESPTVVHYLWYPKPKAVAYAGIAQKESTVVPALHV